MEDVFDITVANVHRFAANGMIVSNCGEEGLPNWGVCNLCSINVAALVDEHGKMNYEELARIAKIGVRFQDNVIDADLYIFEEIRQVQQKVSDASDLALWGLVMHLLK